MGWLTEERRIARERLLELVRALHGEDYRHLRCPHCDLRHVHETATNWVCPRCGSLDPLRTALSAACPYCGCDELEFQWSHGVMACPDCGEMEYDDLEVRLGT